MLKNAAYALLVQVQHQATKHARFLTLPCWYFSAIAIAMTMLDFCDWVKNALNKGMRSVTRCRKIIIVFEEERVRTESQGAKNGGIQVAMPALQHRQIRDSLSLEKGKTGRSKRFLQLAFSQKVDRFDRWRSRIP